MAGPQTTGSARSGSSGIIDTNMLSKKSPMHKLARLARLAGTTIGRDALNSTGMNLLSLLEIKCEHNLNISTHFRGSSRSGSMASQDICPTEYEDWLKMRDRRRSRALSLAQLNYDILKGECLECTEGKEDNEKPNGKY